MCFSGKYLEELVGIEVIHVNVDHAQHIFDFFETHLVVFILVSLMQNVMDPGGIRCKEVAKALRGTNLGIVKCPLPLKHTPHQGSKQLTKVAGDQRPSPMRKIETLPDEAKVLLVSALIPPSK